MLLTGRLLPHWYEARTVEALSGKTLPHHFRRSGYATYAAGKVFDGVLEGSWTAALPFDERLTKCRDARSERRNEPACAPLEETVDAEPASGSAARLHKTREPVPRARSGCGGRTRPGSTLHVITRRSRYLYQRRSRATRRSSRGATTGAGLPKDAGTVASAPHLIRCLRRASLAGSARPTRQLARPPMHIWDASSTRPKGPNLIVAVTADHGMHLGDHGIWSKQTLFDYSLRVPLILKGPGVPRRTVIDAPVETSRLFATLTALAGLKTPPGIEPPLPPLGPHKNAARSVYTRLCKNFESEPGHATCASS